MPAPRRSDLVASGTSLLKRSNPTQLPARERVVGPNQKCYPSEQSVEPPGPHLKQLGVHLPRMPRCRLKQEVYLDTDLGESSACEPRVIKVLASVVEDLKP